MASLDNIARIDIGLNTAAVARASFGIQLIAAPLASFAERVRLYTRYEDGVEDNLPPDVLIALSDSFAQTPRPLVVKVGRMSIARAVIEPVEVMASAPYNVTIGGVLLSYVSTETPTREFIVTGISDAITAAAIPGVAAAVNGGTVEITFSDAVVGISEFKNIRWGAAAPSTAAGIVGADLSAINDEDADWYGLIMADRTKARQLDAAEWIETQDKIFGLASAEPAILNASATDDIISTLRSRQYFRTFAAYHALAATEYPEAAWMAVCFALQPGSETWALKRLASVSPSKLTATQARTIETKGGNTFEFYQPALALTNTGKTAAGEWIDVIRFRDWLKNWIQTSLVQMKINRAKIPYTDGGLQLLGTNVRASLRKGQTVGGIAPDETDEEDKNVLGFILTIPRASSVDAVTKASRVATLSFVARIAGAIHVTRVTGSLAYELN